MADSLKISPTMIKQPAVSRQQSDPQVPFQIKDVSKVNNINVSKQTSSQNQTLLNTDGPKILMDLLKNPENSTHFLHSLFLLQEISQLVPLDNSILNNELEQLFNAIFLKSDHILSELLNQSKQTSPFKGEFYDWVRQLLLDEPELEGQLIQLIKTMNQMRSKSNMKESLIKQSQFLENEFKGLKQVESINLFIEKLESEENISSAFIQMVNELEKSILFNPQMKRHIGIMQYNISRLLISNYPIEDILEIFKEGLGDRFSEFKQWVKQVLEIPLNTNPATVIDRITELLELEVTHSNVLGLTHEKIENIVISLLSSPSNFIPLLHFVLPMQSELLQAYSECWIDVESKENIQLIHVLCAIEIQSLGHFEVEIWQTDDRIKCEVFCPPELVEGFKPMVHILSKRILESSYKLDHVQVKDLVQARSLLDVFSHLNELQNGINVYA